MMMRGRPMRRGRPLMRTAAIGGTAYMVGKKGAQSAQREAGQEARLQELEAQQAAPAAAPAYAAAPAPTSGGMSEDAIAKLKQLAELHEQGILTDDEFSAQKQKILQGA